MQLPRISVITPSFNQGEFLKQNIESVLAQNYPNFEHIVVDGGSSDNSVEVLKSYPHLKWSSAPDRGQADALNKGFAQATGDIIAWVNSDDWYASGAFHAVAEALKDAPLVMGAGAKTDRVGNVTEEVQNVERSWFDLIKYWVFYSVPEQPAVFFRRSVLDEVKRADGSYLDVELRYALDFEFWLRVAKKFPLSKRIDRVLAYYRMYESNKTGTDMAALYREYARVFKRHEKAALQSEVGASIVLPLRQCDDCSTRSISSIFAQDLADFELIIADFAQDIAESTKIKSLVNVFAAEKAPITVRYEKADTKSYFEAFVKVAEKAASPILLGVPSGATLTPQALRTVKNHFSHNALGVEILSVGQDALYQKLMQHESGSEGFNLQGVFSLTEQPVCFVLRNFALRDLMPFRHSQVPGLWLRELLLRLINKAWQVNVDGSCCSLPGVSVENAGDISQKVEFYSDALNSKIILDIQAEYETDAFTRLRAKNKFAIEFGETTLGQAKALLASLPGGWDGVAAKL